MAGWQRAYGQRSDLHVLRPVEFRAAARIDAEAFQDGAYTHRGDPARLPQGVHLSQALDGACSQMIIVIVRNKHSVYVRQIVKCERRWKEALWTSPLCRSRASVPKRINEYAHAINFNQGRGVAEPGSAQAGLWACGINTWIGVKRPQRMPRGPRCCSKKKRGPTLNMSESPPTLVGSGLI